MKSTNRKPTDNRQPVKRRLPQRATRYGLILICLCWPWMTGLAFAPQDADSEALSAAKKQELLRKKQRFDELSDEEKQRMRQLHQDLKASPQQERLKAIMVRYSQWLKTLSPKQRAKIASLPSDQRVQEIRRLVDAQNAQTIRELTQGQLDPENSRVVTRWIDQYLASIESQILESLPEGGFKENYDPNRHRRLLAFSLYRGDDLQHLRPSEAQKAELVKQLRGDARKLLEGMDSEDQSKTIATWVLSSLFSNRRRPMSQADVVRFIERLSDEQREMLESLPLDAMYRELQRLYELERFRGFRGGFPGGQRGRFGGPERRGGGPEGRGPEGRGGERRGGGSQSRGPSGFPR